MTDWSTVSEFASADTSLDAGACAPTAVIAAAGANATIKIIRTVTRICDMGYHLSSPSAS